MKTTTLVVLASAVLFVMGCSSGGDAAAQTNGVKDQKAASNIVKSPEDQPMKEMGDNVKGGGTVVNDPNMVQPGGAYRIEPKNPDDPHFKPDPRLGGG